ncbi:MAG: hypothetical protein GF313_14750 [Caldithrix sp.]|nr:hypothetical protein [Caldithrix sp.]
MSLIKCFFVAISFLILPLILQGQTTDEIQQPQQTNQIEEGEVTELGEQVIRVTIEKPQVTLFTDRIKPEFDDVHLDKSFMREIVGKGEKLIVEDKSRSKDIPQIEVDKLVKRLR